MAGSASGLAPSAKTLLLLAAAALITNAGLTWGGINLLGNAYIANSENILSSSAVFGVFLFLFGLTLGPLMLGLAVQRAIKTSGSFFARFGVPLAALIACIVAVVVAAADMFQIPISFQTVPGPDNLRQTEGGLVFILYGFLGLAILAVLVNLLFCSSRSSSASSTSSNTSTAPKDIQPDGLGHSWKKAVFVVGLYVLVTWLTSFLSPVWNYSFKSYSPALSPYSLIQGVTWTISSAAPINANWEPAVIVFKLYADVVVYMVCVVGTALLALAASQFRGVRNFLHRRIGGFFLSERFVRSKWFGWSSGVTIGEALVIAIYISLNIWWGWFWGFHYPRIKQEAAAMFDPNASMQTAARVLGHFTTLTLSLTVIPATRNSPLLEGCFGIPFERSIKYHRALGRLSYLFVSLHAVVWWSKWAKEGTLWNNVATIDNLLIANTGGVDKNNAGDHLHNDNFTIVIAELGWLVLTVVLVLANFSRRFHYELFHYVHHASWFFMLAALMHAWSHWYFVAGGLTLYFTDKLLRLINSSKEATVKSIVFIPSAGVTRLEVTVNNAFCRGGQHFAGQYAFVNLPAIAGFEWHPFTISSAPGHKSADGEATAVFCIRAMPPQSNLLAGTNKETWTGALARIACSSVGSLGDLAVSIDGPYGRSGHYYERETVFLVASGIGITPFHSIFADLYQRGKRRTATAGAECRELLTRRVVLVWSAREIGLFQLFSDTLATVLSPAAFSETGIRFTCSLHLTGGSSAPGLTKRAKSDAAATAPADIEIAAPLLAGPVSGGPGSASAYPGADGSSANDASLTPVALGLAKPESVALVSGLLAKGRPDLDSEFSRVAAESAGKAFNARPSDRVTAMVCGPQEVIATASLLAGRHGFDFHSEVFTF